MVKFMGAYPSMGATKGYYNQRTAFGGQFRLLRPQPRTSTTINIRSYNYNTGCGGGYGYSCGGFGYSWFPKAMGWLGIANTAVNMLGNLIGSFFPRQPQPTYYSQPIVNNNTKNSDNETIKNLQKQVDELTKQLDAQNKNTEVKENPAAEDPAKKPAEKQENNEQTLAAYTINETTEETTNPQETTVVKTTTVDVPKGKLSGYCGWQTLWKAYNIETPIWSNEGKELRNWFRQQYLDGKDIWNLGSKQEFPTNITDPKTNKEYTFNKETFLNPIDTANGTGRVTTSNLNKIEIKQTTTQTNKKTTYQVIDSSTNKVISTHNTRAEAEAAGKQWQQNQQSKQ